MATSPYFSTSNQYIKYDIHVDEISTDIANNTSYVHVWVIAWRTNTGYTTYGTGTCYCTIDGTQYSQSISSSQEIKYESDTVLFSKYLTINHDADGKKSIYVSSSISHQRFSSSTNGFTVKLSDIPRKAEITSAPNFNDTDNPVLQYSNPAGSAATTLQACISFDGTTDNISYRDIDKSGNSYTFSLSAAERNVLLGATTTSNQKTVYFIIKTVLGGSTYYSSVTKVFSVVNAMPTITGPSYKDTNATTLAITGDDQKIIEGQSTVQFKFSTLTALKSATLVEVKVTVNGVAQTLALSGTTQSNKAIDFGTINSSVDLDATVALKDSRGNITQVTLPVSMLEWKLPTAVISLVRKNNYYDETYLTVNSTTSYLDGHNTLTIQYRYKEVSAGTYGAWISAVDGVVSTMTLDKTKEWNVQVKLTDAIGSTTYNLTVMIGIPIMFIDRMRRSVSVNGFPNEYNQFLADRRISLKDLNQHIVADIWSFTDGAHNGASLYLRKGEDQTILVYLRGEKEGGRIQLRDPDGSTRAQLYSWNGEGHLWLSNPSKTYIGGMWAGSAGGEMELKNNAGNLTVRAGNNGYDSGFVNIKDSNGNTRAEMFAGSAGDGTVNTYDANGNVSINLSGQNGVGTFKKVKASEQVQDLYTGSLSSGSTTFNYGDYNMYIVVAHVHSGGSFITMTIPKALLTTSDQNYCISDEADYIVFKLKYSGSTATLTVGNKSSDGWICNVYGVY